MGLTGVIYAAIVVAWAVFLVPLALYRHDQAARTRSIERFSSAMRVLARSGPGSDRRVVVTPARTVDRVLHPGPSGSPASPTGASAAVRRPTRAALAAAARRRRVVLFALLFLVAGTAVAAATGAVAWWSCALPLAAVVAFLFLARRQVRRASEVYWQQAAEQRHHPTNVVRRSAARVDASHGAERDDADDEPTVTLRPEELAVAAAGLAEEHVVAVSIETSDGGSLWDPLPVTLPTYVDKSVAKRSFRTIELGEPGTWSSGHAVEGGSQAAESQRDAETGEGEAEEAPRAVNG